MNPDHTASTPPKRVGRWVVALALMLAGIAAYMPARHACQAFRLMLAMRSLAAGSTAEDLPIIQETVRRKRGSRDLEALVYRPVRSPAERALVLIAGISELGCYHPRLMAFSRSLSDQGFLVLTPDIRMFRRFEIAPEAMDEVAFWFAQVEGLPGGERIRQIGLGGISFSGTLALITAARPEIRGRVAFVLAIGAYDDPLRCSRRWFAAGPVTVGAGYYPTRFYAKWIIMRAALDLLPSAQEQQFLSTVLEDLLLQKQVPPPPVTLSPEAGRWYRMATMREDEADPALAQEIEDHLVPRLYGPITPGRAAAEVRCPVFLIHGAHDDLIPPEESFALRDRLKHTKNYLLISPFLTHTHPLERPLRWGEKLHGAVDLFTFCYGFARTV